MKKFMTFLIIFTSIIFISFSYLFLTKPKNMPFIGHFFDKVFYGSLYYLTKPDSSYIYKKHEGLDLKVHVFVPDNPKTDSSLLLFHGGGWAFGSSYSLFKICKDLSDNGITCFSAEYRLSLKHSSKVQDSMSDAREVYNWISENSEKLNINKEKIVVGGGSSGGHLAASLAMIPDDSGSTVDNISALVFFNPAINTTFFDNGYELPENIGERRKKFWLYLKRLFDGKSVELSPSNWIKEDLPPSIIFHGKNDRTIPLPIIEEFTKHMKEKGNEIKLLTWEGKGHQFYRWDKESYNEVINELLSFLKEQTFNF